MIRAVLDTNQFVSALLSRKGIQGRILTLWQAGLFQMAVSPAIIEEIARVLTSPKISLKYGIRAKQVVDLIHMVSHEALIVPGKTPVDVIKEDRSDNAILACALEAEAHVIVSGDAHLLQLTSFKGIPIITGRRFLELIEVD